MDKNEIKIDGSENIVITDINGSQITVNLNDTDDLRRQIGSFGERLNLLLEKLSATDISKIGKIMEETTQDLIGANIYFTTMAELHGARELNAMTFGVTITNLNKDIRYFGAPFFKVTPPIDYFDDGRSHDTFQMLPLNDVKFPVRLERGEQKFVSFEITAGAFDMYKKHFEKHPTAQIQIFVPTTLGEVYESNILTLEEFWKRYDWIFKA